MGTRKKWMVQGGFLLLVIVGTAYGLLRGADLQALLQTLRGADLRYCILGLVCVVGFVLLESVILRVIFLKLGGKTRMTHCCLYSFVGFFFSCITPSAGGGQPAQVYFMHKDGIPPAASIPVLMLVTIAYKLVLVLYGLGVLLLWPMTLMEALDGLWWWFYLGLGANLLFVSVYIGLLLCPRGTGRILMLGLTWLPVGVKRKQRWGEKLEQAMIDYKRAADLMKKRFTMVLLVLLLTLLQRTLMFFVTWLCLRGLGMDGFWGDVVTMQAMIALGTELLPLPGAMGANETMFLRMFGNIFPQTQVLPLLILSRGLGYYGQLLISSLFTAVAAMSIGKRKKNDWIL